MPCSVLAPSHRWRLAISILTGWLLSGCQSYEPSPLDIEGFGVSLNDRVVDVEPLTAFIDRLDIDGAEAPVQFDLSDGISYAEGEVLALFYNADLRLARLEAGVAMATRDTAGLWEDPVFGFDGAEIVSPAAPFEFGLMGSLTIPISGRLEVEKDRAAAAYEAQLRSLVNAEWQTRSNLRRAWARWTAIDAQSLLLADMILDLGRIAQTARHLEIAGELNRVERRLLDIELADRRIQATEIELELIEAEALLMDILGLSLDNADLLIPAFPNVAIPHIEDLTLRLIESNTELAVHFASYRTAEETLRLEVKKQFPDIVIGSGYGTEFNDHRVMFGLSIPIPILNANRAGIAEARARREVARAEAETTFARLFRSLHAAQTALQVNQEQRDRYETLIVPLLNEQANDIDRIAALGELDVFVLLQTITRTLAAKQQLIELRIDEIDAATTLSTILGPDMPANPTPVDSHTSVIDGGDTP